MNHSNHIEKFIITGLPRTGSNLLQHSLKSSSELVVYNELFNKEKILWGYEELDSQDMQKLYDFRNKQPFDFIQGIFADYGGSCNTVGFKIFYMQGRMQECPELAENIWPFLNKIENLKVIDITRTNKLKQYVSWKIADITQVWYESKTQPSVRQEDITITLDYDELVAVFKFYKNIRNEALPYLEGKEMLKLTSEQLTTEYDYSIMQVQSFLGVTPMILKPKTFKQQRRSMSEVITNYYELKEQFSGTQWLEYFDE